MATFVLLSVELYGTRHEVREFNEGLDSALRALEHCTVRHADERHRDGLLKIRHLDKANGRGRQPILTLEAEELEDASG